MTVAILSGMAPDGSRSEDDRAPSEDLAGRISASCAIGDWEENYVDQAPAEMTASPQRSAVYTGLRRVNMVDLKCGV